MKKPPQRTGAASICQLEGERNSVTIVLIWFRGGFIRGAAALAVLGGQGPRG